MRRVRVLAADDHALILTGIKTVLERRYDVVGTANDGRELVEICLRLKPDIVVLDISMPELNGLEACKQIKAVESETRVVFVSMHLDRMYMQRAFEAGGSAYVLKIGAADELLEAIEDVLAGKIYVSPGLRDDDNDDSRFRSYPPQVLTERQREILALIAEGRLSKEIAHILNISMKTVDFHRGRIMSRLGAHSVGELVRRGIEDGLIPPSTPKNS